MTYVLALIAMANRANVFDLAVWCFSGFSALFPLVFAAVYWKRATKAGAEAMAVAWAKELARHGIRAASIAPGFIGTDMVMAMKPEAREKMTKGIPAGRIGDPDEIAATVQFILENDYVSGRCFGVDGALRL